MCARLRPGGGGGGGAGAGFCQLLFISKNQTGAADDESQVIQL